MRSAGRAVVALLALAGLALLGWGIFRGLGERKFLGTAVKSLGEVTSIQTTPIDEQTNRYCAIVTFSPAKGNATSFTNANCPTSQQQRIGDKVPVLYDPAEPTNARIVQNFSPLGAWVVAIPFFAGTVLAWLAAFAAALIVKRFVR